MSTKEAKLTPLDQEIQHHIDEISSYLVPVFQTNSHIRDYKINNVPSVSDLRSLEETPIPEVGRPTKEIADQLIEDVFKKSMLCQHPRFLSFVAGAVSPYSLSGTILTDVFNLHGGGFDEAPGACLIEEKLVKWMGELAGYPSSCGGVFTSGGSMSNLSALIAARDTILGEEEYSKGVAYISDQTHSSVAKGLRCIGIRNKQIRIIPTDECFRMRPDLLKNEIEKDIQNGLLPFVIIATLGTTNTGSIDPLDELADLRDHYHMWLHVDGAYGGSILFSNTYRHLAKGIERSDSLSWDTHKWAMQTYSCSTLIARDKQKLLNSFTEHPEYLEDVINKEHTDPWDLGPEMSRPHRAIKLWFTIQAIGTKRLSNMIDETIAHADLAKNLLEENDDVEITSLPSCAALTYRYAPKDIDPKFYDELNAHISKLAVADQYCYVVTTIVKGKRVLRLCFVNGMTREEDVKNSVEYLNRLNEIAKMNFLK